MAIETTLFSIACFEDSVNGAVLEQTPLLIPRHPQNLSDAIPRRTSALVQSAHDPRLWRPATFGSPPLTLLRSHKSQSTVSSRLRHWCSSRYLRISPLHLEFHIPLPASSLAVFEAPSQLSREISPQTCQAACGLFTPNKSGQRLVPTCHRGCWHVVGRTFF